MLFYRVFQVLSTFLLLKLMKIKIKNALLKALQVLTVHHHQNPFHEEQLLHNYIILQQ